MHLVIVFYNIGGYHAARLRETYLVCQQKGWDFTAIEVTDNTTDRPWGKMDDLLSFEVKTLLPIAATPNTIDRSPFSQVAASLITECLTDIDPDIVAIPGWGFPVSRAALSWCQKHRVPTILMSESKQDDEPRQWWKELLKSQLYIKKYDAGLVGSQQHKDYLVKLGFAEEKIFLGYDVVDNEYFSTGASRARQDIISTRKREPNIPHKSYFFTANRLIERKNIARLIEAYALYDREINSEDSWDLVVCGSGQELDNIQTIVNNYKLENRVHFPGFITYDRTPDWYGLASAFVHPAIQEQWGLVVNEACAAGLPILSSNTVGATRELVVEGKNGYLFNPEDKQDMANALLKIHRLESASRDRLGIASQTIVKKYHPSVFARGIFAAIDSTLLVKNSN
ncbi:glycosyltransferase family 4 protein [Waterburya agarophytonicola K14]|uniref:Glycosyltransferase family 4 protein n=1 Tax=Waterburya agarophytonicola KI4 TaxID=2874699 RepID=A0A964FF03_9CYAN|nr:glycosyltransferase family 4 protein [Waterburya agarophytonicola]MCC0176426.1 glycosyltransferase family 4 protein [Waterburya agarophytonicola KI4]